MVSVSALMKIPLFLGLPANVLTDLTPAVRRVEVPAGDWLFCESEDANELYYLDQGRVDIFINDPGQGPGLVHIVRPGECFGWSALVPPNFFTASAQANTDCEVLIVSAELLKVQMRNHPELAWAIFENISSTIAQRLEGTRIRLLSASLGDLLRGGKSTETAKGDSSRNQFLKPKF